MRSHLLFLALGLTACAVETTPDEASYEDVVASKADDNRLDWNTPLTTRNDLAIDFSIHFPIPFRAVQSELTGEGTFVSPNFYAGADDGFGDFRRFSASDQCRLVADREGTLDGTGPFRIHAATATKVGHVGRRLTLDIAENDHGLERIVCYRHEGPGQTIASVQAAFGSQERGYYLRMSDASDGPVDRAARDLDAILGGAADSARYPTLMGPARADETSFGEIAPGSRFLAWTLDLEAGARAHVQAFGVRDRSTDTMLFIYRANESGRPTGRALARNDDVDARSLASGLYFDASAAGSYVALVRLYDPAADAEVALRWTAGVPCTPAGATCGERSYCRVDLGESCDASAPGLCAPMRTVCPKNIAPVCGCDGNMYSNACEASMDGVNVAYSGECR